MKDLIREWRLTKSFNTLKKLC
ncbi:hypothetical protein C5167_037882 [Papaver somniferum]|uniref:Uncharacterized protein n=1 Tax=Papaver somniferum TaxID=3469 RepID=A0A4Y7IBZ1_PAPSO|nr:hypothetical protein C5167_037882 [Papaver somniferum]